ncbi:MAG: hypothetical protein JNL88_03575 [Bacteroidia bacterium]|nr:hypothetical protein [Bacteroidia bacterium]
MKSNFSVYLMILVFLMEMTSKSVFLLNFELRRDYFAKVLCVKRDIPGNCCKGTCQLNKELGEQSEREKNQGPLQVLFQDTVLFDLLELHLKFYYHEETLADHVPAREVLKGTVGGIFRPPAV